MHFQDVIEGEFHIFAGALESPIGDGYTAALIVKHKRDPASRDAFRDDSLSCGHRWASAEEALNYALRKARNLIRKEPELLFD